MIDLKNVFLFFVGETEENNSKVITSSIGTHEQDDKNKDLACSEKHKKQPQPCDSQEGEIGYYELKDQDMELVELSTSNNLTSNRQQHHRELPVDVPESFVGKSFLILLLWFTIAIAIDLYLNESNYNFCIKCFKV